MHFIEEENLIKRMYPFLKISQKCGSATDSLEVQMDKQNEITINSEEVFEEVIDQANLGKSTTDEVEKLLKEQYPWQMNDAERLYSGFIPELPESGEQQTLLTERQSFLAWLADKPQRIYGGESLSRFEEILNSYSEMQNLSKLLIEFYDKGKYQDMVKQLMKYENRATEIPLLIVIEGNDEKRVIYSQIRKVWFPKLNKEKSVIVVVINKSKLMAMEQV